MLNHFRQMAIFAKTADHGSFRGAAQTLGLSPSVVSHHIAALEDQLGVALFYRSTRKLSLTREGEQLLQAAHAMIVAAETGLHAISDRANAPSGELRVTIPAVLAQSVLLDRIGAFSVDYPKVRLVLDFSDSRRELISGGFDIAIRMGSLKDSTLKAKKLYDVERRVVAAPTYLATREPPRSPAELTTWDWITFSPVQAEKPTFSKAGKPAVTLRLPPSRIAVNDANALCRLTCAGAGLALLLDFLTDPHLSDGTLVSLVDDWRATPVGVYAVWHANAPRHGLAKLLIDRLSTGSGEG